MWVGGRWNPPKGGPPPSNESPGEPPNIGCTWAGGYWAWEGTEGEWRFIPGHWNAPPPLVETPGAPPVPESKWVSGNWISIKGKFEWVAGYWDDDDFDNTVVFITGPCAIHVTVPVHASAVFVARARLEPTDPAVCPTPLLLSSLHPRAPPRQLPRLCA